MSLADRNANTEHAIVRTTVPALESILGHAYPVLDHGMIRVIDYMGDQAAVVQMARVSYGVGTDTPSSDRSLLRYLFSHRHTSPFEGCEIKLHLKMPIFVARQHIRHRMASINEYSARYSIMTDEFYFPTLEQVKYQSTDNKQGRSDTVDPEAAQAVIDLLMDTSKTCYRRYEKMNEENIARELSRIGLTLNTYTEMYWKIDLHNLLHYLRLRFDKHAQYEIRVYAELMFDIVKEWVPDIAQAFVDYSLEARTFSRMEIETLGKMMRGEPVVQQKSGMSKREWKDFMSLMDGLKQTADSNGPTPFQTIPSEEIEKHDITS